MDQSNRVARQILLSEIMNVRNVIRYSSRQRMNDEDVAQHSFMVSLYSLVIAKDYERVTGAAVNTGILLERAIVHDLDEGLTGDFQRTVKYANPELKAALDEVAEGFLNVLLDRFDSSVSSLIIFRWYSAKADDLEGDILAVADFMAVASYIHSEYNSGARNLLALITSCSEYGRSLADRVRTNRPYLEQVVVDTIAMLTSLRSKIDE